MIVNGLTPEQYLQFHAEYAAAPCTRAAIEEIHRRYFPTAYNAYYPDEYYADKDYRLAYVPTGHMRCLVTQGGKMVWVTHPPHPDPEVQKDLDAKRVAVDAYWRARRQGATT